MDTTISHRIARRRADDDQPVSAEEAAGLLALSRRAMRLRVTLRAARDEVALRDAVAGYVVAAAARGTSFQRTRDAIELFVHERAPKPAHDLLDLVLRLASEVCRTSPQLREAL